MSSYDLGILPVNTPVIRNDFSVTSSQPTDIFKFRVQGSKKLNLSLTDISVGDDADLRLYRDNGNGVFDAGDRQIASSRRSGSRDDSINIQTSTDTYFAQVSRFTPGSTGRVNYDLAISATNSPSNLVPKDVRVGNLSRDLTYTGKISSTDTADTYAFSLGLYEGVNISLRGLSNDADIRLIRDSNRNGIVDQGEVARSSTRSGSLSEAISGLDRAGDYLLQVYQFSGATNYQLKFDHYTSSRP
jgi:hypothetical protein